LKNWGVEGYVVIGIVIALLVTFCLTVIAVEVREWWKERNYSRTVREGKKRAAPAHDRDGRR
jgi:heme/copper-type cytochrome/quinol oxidase subunit 2